MLEKRIYLNLFLLASTAVLFVSILLVVIFYNFYINEQKQSLKDYSHIMVNVLEAIELKDFEVITDTENLGYRITIIKNNGRVIFDTTTDPTYLENHIGREEIQEALEKGYGESIRYSNTIQRKLIIMPFYFLAI